MPGGPRGAGGDAAQEPAGPHKPAVVPPNAKRQAADPRVRKPFFLAWPRILAFLINLYYKTVRFRFFGNLLHPEGKPMIYVCWHSEEVTMLPRCGFTGGNVMVSKSRDGDILATVISRWGYKVSRGSSSKGAVAALKSLRAALEAGDSIILAVDGPRGPRRKAKAGAFHLSERLGVPICPVGVAVSRAHVFRKSWSLSRVPLPFSRVCAVFGDLFQAGPETRKLERGEKESRLAGLLEAATQEAEAKLKNWSASCN
ncbi:MAG: lysophospholipid acyltransferase family protein [Deltaproteobacteria bacterium]|nr:lysophospholipid acyltransferase family protein [Deltaproteobacteria bacterium]